MKAIMDLHTHTLAAGHAYSTLLENIDAALAMGLQYLGMSEHGPTSPGGPHNFFFSNYKVIPRIYDREENTGRVIPKPDGSLRLLCGVEANICSTNGELDLEERYLQKMDYALASIHPFAFTAGSRKENTLASVRAFQNPYVKILGHPDDGRFPLDYDEGRGRCGARGQTGTGGVGSEQFIPESPVGQTRRQRKYYRAVKDLHEV